MPYHWTEQAPVLEAITRINNDGGGAVLNQEQVKLLMSSEAATDARHPQHAAMSTILRQFYAANHTGIAGPDGNGG